MADDVAEPRPRRDLGPLQGLASSPLWSFARRATAKKAAPTPVSTAAAQQFPPLNAFLNSRLWLWVTTYARHRIGLRHRFPDYAGRLNDTGIYPLVGTADGILRIAIAGDWGTGTDEAAMVAAQMQKFDAHYTIHLGDVYYVGDAADVKEKFQGIASRDGYQPTCWPDGSAGTFALNGNHEMYARGFGYFDYILPSLNQAASFFALFNDHWFIIGLDTAYNSISLPFIEEIFTPNCALPEPHMIWLRGLRRKLGKRGIILLSHHQYFSVFERGFTRPAIQLTEIISRPVLWFWGHEHRMAIYGEYATDGGIAAHGRCIGHGGMPVDLPPDPLPESEVPLLFSDKVKYENDEADLNVGRNGFAKLTFTGNMLAVDYADLQGDTVYTETWRTQDGQLERLTKTPPI